MRNATHVDLVAHVILLVSNIHKEEKAVSSLLNVEISKRDCAKPSNRSGHEV